MQAVNETAVITYKNVKDFADTFNATVFEYSMTKESYDASPINSIFESIARRSIGMKEEVYF